MPPNTYGSAFAVTVFGESHGSCVGVVVDGCPAGLPLSIEDLQRPLRNRIPVLPALSSGRREEDRVDLLSGVFRNKTTGAPICALVWNKDVDDSSYLELEGIPRPGHADYPAYVKYGGYNDFRGGGIFSGRITVPYIVAGAIALKLLNRAGVEVLAYTVKIAGVEARPLPLNVVKSMIMKSPVKCGDLEASNLMVKEILKAASEGDSVGGLVEISVLNLPPGLGDPLFNSLDSELARLLFAIPAVKGVEFGLGFKSIDTRGSMFNDQYTIKKGRVETESNNVGGILGGLATGMPLTARVAFKPTPSISKLQKSVDLRSMKLRKIKVTGRHDPCVVPKAVPAVESVVSIVLTDHLLRAGVIPRIVEEL